jgi:predicted ATPase
MHYALFIVIGGTQPNQSAVFRDDDGRTTKLRLKMAAAPPFEQLDGLVGREGEVNLLLEAYQRVLKSSCSCEVVRVHGESGNGKTALVLETFRNQRKDSTMISGKFDVIHSQRPYSAIVDALTQLCSAATWSNISNQEKFQASLCRRLSSSDMNILTKLIPSIEPRLATLLSSNSAEEETKMDASGDQLSNDVAFAFARFAEIVRSFLYLVARFMPSPLVLFLDDVHAADPESQSLISSLTWQHSESCNLLLILAYRDDNDERNKLLEKRMISSSTVFGVTDIKVGNLDEEDVNKLTSKILRMDAEFTDALSRLITQRTGGNIYFCLQFLQVLKNTNLLEYSFGGGHPSWKWNLERIRADTSVTENVALLLTSKILQLPLDVQLTLKLAACLGFYFDITFLEGIVMQERDALTSESSNSPSVSSTEASNEEPLQSSSFSQIIAAAVEGNLIDRAEGAIYKFNHDRVLQAVYEMIPSRSERDNLHWRIGQVLWKELQKKQLEKQIESGARDDWLLFAAAEQLNLGYGCGFVTGSVTPLELARLNLAAGNAAIGKSAFRHAAGFLSKGVELVKGWWRTDYSLCLELYTLSAEAEYAASNFECCDRRIADVLSNGRCLEDKLRVYLLKVQSQGVRGSVLEALNESVAVLQVLGEAIPRRPNLLNLLYELAKTKRVLRGRKPADLEALPNMTNTLKAWALKFLQRIVTFSWYAGQIESMVVAVFRMMQLTCKFGVSSQGAFALASYGLALGSLGDFETAHECGKVAMKLAKRPHTSSSYACVVSTVFSFLHHLKQPVINCLDHFLDGYYAAMKSGDIEGAALCLSKYGPLGIYLGKNLDVVVSEMEGFRQTYCNEFERNFALMFLTPFHQFALSMMGNSENPRDLVCKESYKLEVQRTGNMIAKVTFTVARMILLYILNNVEDASKELATLDMDLVSRGTHYATPFVLMYAALILLAMARKTGKRVFLRRAMVSKRIMQKFAKAGNLNMPPLLNLVTAEQASFRRSRCGEVKKAYESAVRVAAQSGCSVVAAIGNERAGEYMLSIGDLFWAETFLSRALFLYDEWGATTKTKEMIDQHAFLDNTAHEPLTRSNVHVTMRKRYSFKESNERRRLSLLVRD